MNILVAKSKEECAAWKEIAVVVDVLCTATTVCALLKQQDRLVGLCAEEATAEKLANLHPGLALFSEQTLVIAHQDNSPYLAEKLPPEEAALLIEPQPALAVNALRQAKIILLGGFCNFRAIAKVLTQQKKDILIVPATLFWDGQQEEDTLCAVAFKEFLQRSVDPKSAVESFGATTRFSEFRTQGSKTASSDLNLALGIDQLPIPVQVIQPAGEACAICCVFGSSNPALFSKKAGSSGTPSASSPQNSSPRKTQHGSKLKEFFSVLAQSAKEEKEDLERSIRRVAERTQRKTRHRIDDPLDALRKKENQQQAANDNLPLEDTSPADVSPAQSTQKPEVAPADSNPVQKDAFGKRGISLDNVPQKPLAKEGIKMSEMGNNEVQKDAFGKRGISLDDVSQKPSAKEGIRMSEMGNNEVKKDAFGRRSISLDFSEDSSQGQNDNPATPVQGSPRQRVISLDTEPLPIQEQSSRPHNGPKKAIVLFSGGLDSTTCLYWAIAQGYTCETLTVFYGQRHVREIESARKITDLLGVKHHFIELNLPWLGETCSLVNQDKPLPNIAVEEIPHAGIPSTYVPGRNLMFLAIAGSLLDSVGAQAIIAGPNAIDFSGYPDCTPAFFKSAAEALNRGTKQGVQEGIEVLAPLMRLSKAEIVKLAAKLKVPFELTWSCYAGGDKPCGKCDSCKLRAKGFAEAGVRDTALDK